jgi:hypothetical protein
VDPVDPVDPVIGRRDDIPRKRLSGLGLIWRVPVATVCSAAGSAGPRFAPLGK